MGFATHSVVNGVKMDASGPIRGGLGPAAGTRAVRAGNLLGVIELVSAKGPSRSAHHCCGTPWHRLGAEVGGTTVPVPAAPQGLPGPDTPLVETLGRRS